MQIKPDTMAILKEIIHNPVIADYNNHPLLPLWITGGKQEERSRLLLWIMAEIMKPGKNLNIMHFNSLGDIVYLKTHPYDGEVLKYNFNEMNSSTAIDNFRQAYKSTDFLLVDNAETIPSNLLIQDEFFKMYCHMTAGNKPVVIAANANFMDIDFDVRLKTRFAIGSVVSL